MLMKKLLNLVLIFLIMLAGSTGQRAYASEDQYYTHYVTDIFTDISASDWFAGVVQQAYTLDLMKGITQTTFEPQAGMTRAMFVKVLYTMNQSPAVENTGIPFVDTALSEWYYDAVCWAYANHITSGISEHHFGPSDHVTRSQAVRFLYSFSGEPVVSGELNGFEDTGLVDGWAQDAFVWAIQKGIIKGSLDNGLLNLNPRQELKRSEAAALLTAFENLQFGITADSSLPEETWIPKSDVQIGVKLPVLMYHEVSDDVWGLDYLFVSPARMRSQLQWLRDNGYETIFFSDLPHLSWYRKPILLTFDDGYEGNYTNLFPLLKEFGMKATIFVVTGEIGTEYRMTSDQLKEMSDSGLVSIQSHTNSHSRMNTLNESQLLDECQESKTIISSITGKSPYVLSYPEGKYNTLVISIVSEFYDFGVLDRNGSWKTNSRTWYRITRTVIPRSFTLKQFAAEVRR